MFFEVFSEHSTCYDIIQVCIALCLIVVIILLILIEKIKRPLYRRRSQL